MENCLFATIKIAMVIKIKLFTEGTRIFIRLSMADCYRDNHPLSLLLAGNNRQHPLCQCLRGLRFSFKV